MKNNFILSKECQRKLEKERFLSLPCVKKKKKKKKKKKPPPKKTKKNFFILIKFSKLNFKIEVFFFFFP